MIVTAAPVDWLDQAREAVEGHGPAGCADWLRALVAWQCTVFSHDSAQDGHVPTADARELLDGGRGQCANAVTVFLWLCRELAGFTGRPVHLRHQSGLEHVVAEVYLPRAITPHGGGVVDPDNGLVYTAPEGFPTSYCWVRPFPDWIAAERDGLALAPDRETPAADLWELYTDGPERLAFQVGDTCNAACVMCWQARRRERDGRKHRETPASVVVGALERYRQSVRTVELVSFGEPLANPAFGEMVAAVGAARTWEDKPVQLSLITNGSLLHRHVDALARLPGWLTVSVDSPVPERYQEIRRGLRFDRVEANLRAVIGHPERHPERRVGVNCTVFETNVGDLPAMARWCRDMGVDYLAVLRGARLFTTDAAGFELATGAPALVAAVEAARAVLAGTACVLDDFATGRTLGAQAPEVPPHRRFCPLPWRQLDVGPDGRAHPCCRAHHTDLGSVETGDPWHDEPARTLRRQILAGAVDPERFHDCAVCPNLGFTNGAQTP